MRFQIHVTVLILLKGFCARNSRLIQIKLTWASAATDQVVVVLARVSGLGPCVLGLFWMFNTIAIAVYHFSWKMQSDVWELSIPMATYHWW